MKWDVRVETNGQQPYSSVEDLTAAEREMPPYAYCLPRYSRLDSTYRNAPGQNPVGQNGYISAEMSGADGRFLKPPTITVMFDRLKTSNGVALTFNRISGDHASFLQISWYKDEKLVKEREFSPDGSEYFCREKVSVFNRMVITFLQTSRPYRYLWLAGIKNQRMTDGGGLKIVYDDIALGAKEDGTAETEDKDYYVDLQDLKKEIEFPDYAMCIPRYSRLDGNFSNAPDILEDMGYVSDSISDGEGAFLRPPVLTFTFTQNYSSVGITLDFNDHTDDYCSEVNLKWYRDGELLADQDYQPDGSSYFCYGIVDYYNKVVITFQKTSKPYRNVFLTGITWGLVRVFRDDEVESVDCLAEISPISEEVSVNTMEYTIRSKSPYAFEFQKKQKQTLYFDEAIMGIFYLKDGKQLSDTRYSVETQDVVGLLDVNQYMGGVFENKPVKELLDDIMAGEDVPYFLDESYQDTTVSGYLPICSKRTALQQLAFAIGALVDTSYDRNLQIYPQPAEVGGEITPKEIFTGLSIEHGDIITGIRLMVHQYVPGTEKAELYKGILDGRSKLEFSEPYHSLSVTGGELGEHGENYAWITGHGETVVLSGMKYNHSTAALLKENPKITQNKNTAEVREATLVTNDNAGEVLERVYKRYVNNESVRCRMIVGDHELGDRVAVDTGFKGKKEGVITKMDFRFSRREITAEVTIE